MWLIEGEGYTVDEVELNTKLLDMVAMVISFGEYLRPEGREDYIERFIEHICDGAKGMCTICPCLVLFRSPERFIVYPCYAVTYLLNCVCHSHWCPYGTGSTMVPLEVISRVGAVSRDELAGRADVLLDPPHVVSNLRKDLEEEKHLTKQLGAEIDQKKHEYVFLCTLSTVIGDY